jgi:4-hydroxy-tetrahydrodipicolinate synthase
MRDVSRAKPQAAGTDTIHSSMPTNRKSSIFRGALTALVTPFSPDGSAVDLARLSEHIHFQAEGNVTGVVPCGTTGESPTLSDEEHRSVVETTIEVAHSLNLKVIAGAGSNSTAHAIELHKFAKDAGADASLQVNPYYNKPSQEGLYRHFMAIADSCDLPICLYNIPGRSAVALSPETIERLAKHPNIHAIKEATGSLDSASEISARTNLALLSGDDSLTLPFAAVGAVGVVSVVSNIVPEKVAALCQAFNSGQWEEARRMHFDLLPLSRGLLTLDTNPIPIKAAMEKLGRDTGALRLPMCRANKSAMEAIEKLLKQQKLSASPAAAAH